MRHERASDRACGPYRRFCRIGRTRAGVSVLAVILAGCGDGLRSADRELVERGPPLVVTGPIATGPVTEPPGQVALFRPFGPTLLGDTIVIADSGNDRIVALDQGLRVLWVSGREGAGPGEFRIPYTVRPARDGVLVLEMGNARYTELDRSGAYRRTFASGGAASSFGVASDGGILVPARSPTDYVVRRHEGSERPFAPRPDTLTGDEAERSTAGGAPRLALTAGDTVHVFDDSRGILLKYAPDGRIVQRRILPHSMLDSMLASSRARFDALERQGIEMISSSLSKGLTVTRDGRLLLFLSSGTTTGFLIDPGTYEVRRIVVPDRTSRWAPLHSAHAALLAGDRLFAMTADAIIAWSVEDARLP